MKTTDYVHTHVNGAYRLKWNHMTEETRCSGVKYAVILIQRNTFEFLKIVFQMAAFIRIGITISKIARFENNNRHLMFLLLSSGSKKRFFLFISKMSYATEL